MIRVVFSREAMIAAGIDPDATHTIDFSQCRTTGDLQAETMNDLVIHRGVTPYIEIDGAVIGGGK